MRPIFPYSPPAPPVTLLINLASPCAEAMEMVHSRLAGAVVGRAASFGRATAMRRSKKLAIACGVVAVGIAVALLPRGPKNSPAANKSATAHGRPVPRQRVPRATAPVEVPDDEVELPRLLARIDDIDDAAGANSESSSDKNRERITAEPLFGGGDAPAADAWRPSTKAPPLRAEPVHRRIEKAHDVFDDSLDPPPADGETPWQLKAAAAPRTHRVQNGDTLSDLAARYLGSSERFWEIFTANRDRLRTPDLLPIGLELRIPPDEPVGRTVPPSDLEAPLVPLPGKSGGR